MIAEDKKMKADLLFKECTEKHWDFETLARYVLVKHVKKKKKNVMKDTHSENLRGQDRMTKRQNFNFFDQK